MTYWKERLAAGLFSGLRYVWPGRFISELEWGSAVAPLESAMEVREIVESDIVSNLPDKSSVQTWPSG